MRRQQRQTLLFFFFNDTATTEIYTLSLHDALPISLFWIFTLFPTRVPGITTTFWPRLQRSPITARSEEHTSELQSLAYLVCRLLLEKKNNRLADAHRPPPTHAHHRGPRDGADSELD